MDKDCLWCPHPVSAHSEYYGGLCAWDVTVLQDADVPYSISCWCGGTDATAGPRLLIRDRSIPLVKIEGGYKIEAV